MKSDSIRILIVFSILLIIGALSVPSGFDLSSDKLSGQVVPSLSLPTCNVSTDEYVCNGDFELTPLYPFPSQAFTCGSAWTKFSIVPFWCQMAYTPDLSSVTPDSSLRSAKMWELADDISNPFRTGEGILTELKIPLKQGQKYELSFDTKAQVANNQTSLITSTYVNAELNSGLIDNQGNQIITTLPWYFISTFDQPVVSKLNIPYNSPVWTKVKQTFVANGPHTFLAINALAEDVTYSPNNIAWFLFDNISLKAIYEIDIDIKKKIIKVDSQNGLVTYAIDVKNFGPDNATGVLINDSLPLGLNYVSHKSPQGVTYLPSNGDIKVASIPKNNSFTVEISASFIPDDCRGFDNIVKLISTNQDDTNPNNNISSVFFKPDNCPVDPDDPTLRLNEVREDR